MNKHSNNDIIPSEDEIEINTLKSLALMDKVSLNEDLKWVNKKFKTTKKSNSHNNTKTNPNLKIDKNLVLKNLFLIEKDLNKLQIRMQEKENFWIQKINFSTNEFSDILKEYLSDDFNKNKNEVNDNQQNLITKNKLEF